MSARVISNRASSLQDRVLLFIWALIATMFRLVGLLLVTHFLISHLQSPNDHLPNLAKHGGVLAGCSVCTLLLSTYDCKRRSLHWDMHLHILFLVPFVVEMLYIGFILLRGPFPEWLSASHNDLLARIVIVAGLLFGMPEVLCVLDAPYRGLMFDLKNGDGLGLDEFPILTPERVADYEACYAIVRYHATH
ncbi:hypothetical protein HD554DRAFT_1814161 [Boletus coccyginus]|nr:hypothetical protein HD554DRAFT_1814161 [Boletus coccyginus]